MRSGTLKFFPIADHRFHGFNFYLVCFGRIVQTAEIQHFAKDVFVSAEAEHLKVFQTEHENESRDFTIVALGSVKDPAGRSWGAACRFLFLRPVFSPPISRAILDIAV